MFHIKRLYSFILQSFVPVFAMTFGICLFIVLMQFLWKYVEDLVGKGLDNLVLAELFFYAGLSLIPLALPLSILLASLMTFGNMGERFELTAIKASGVSLLKAMRPLIILIVFISIGAFFFQNETMPRINVKFKTLLISVKQKSPELDIPEGSFYNGIDGYSIYVKKKNPDIGMLYGVMIYDTSKGFNDMSIFICDSAKMRMSETKDFLRLSLYSGQRFSSDKETNVNNNTPVYDADNSKNTPYSRENFKIKDIIIRFDANFKRMEESSLEGSQISMNLRELNHAIDSLKYTLDSLNRDDRNFIKKLYLNPQVVDTSNVYNENNIKPINLDSLLNTFSRTELISIFERARSKGESGASTFQYQSWSKTTMQSKIRYYQVESHRKFTLSFACIIFFFIGAPLGAIIRKGGLGMPVIISVILFIIYYIFDNVGVKMARDGVWEIWQGMWLSSFILFPLGVFLTYKSMNDSALFNTEAYGKFVRKILHIKTNPIIENENEVDPKDVKFIEEIGANPQMVQDLRSLDSNTLKDIIKNYQQYNYDRNVQPIALAILKERNESFFGIRLRNIDYEEIKQSYQAFFKSVLIALVLYIPGLLSSFFGTTVALLINLAYLIFTIRTFFYYYDFYKSIDRKQKTSKASLKLLGLYILPIIFYPYLKKEMKEDMDNLR